MRGALRHGLGQVPDPPVEKKSVVELVFVALEQLRRGGRPPCDAVVSPSGTGIGAPGGRVVEHAVELVDLAPTILEAAGQEVAPELQGFSLLDAVRGGEAPQREWVFAETGAVKMLRGERYKLVYYPGQTYGELYDLEADPGEMRNLWNDATCSKLRGEYGRRG